VLKTYTAKNADHEPIEYGFWFQDLLPEN
jgi:hypothetical protein